MKKKIIALSVAAILLVMAIAGGTYAYLTDTDNATNVMTLGKVDIKQLEYERAVDGNGEYISTGTTDKYGYVPSELKEFTQNKPLYPVVGNIEWVPNYQQSFGQIGAPGSLTMMAMENVVDKMVFVENVGKSDAYVRTIIALEQGSVPADKIWNLVHTSGDENHWDKQHDVAEGTAITDVTIDGNKYYIISYTYKGASSANYNGILEAGKTSYVNLSQVFMTSEATNEDCIALDGNNNGVYDILVLSQAAQTNGFANANAALNTAFGEINAANVVEWFEALN